MVIEKLQKKQNNSLQEISDVVTANDKSVLLTKIAKTSMQTKLS